jgi:hypothetical protein
VAGVRSWLFSAKSRGAHVWVQVRAGEAGQRGLMGTLVMSPEEWAELKELVNPWATTVEEVPWR